MTTRKILSLLMKHENNRIVWLVAGPPQIPKFGLSRFDLKEDGHIAPSNDLAAYFGKVNLMYKKGLLEIDGYFKPKSLKAFLDGQYGAFILKISPEGRNMVETKNCIAAGI